MICRVPHAALPEVEGVAKVVGGGRRRSRSREWRAPPELEVGGAAGVGSGGPAGAGAGGAAWGGEKRRAELEGEVREMRQKEW